MRLLYWGPLLLLLAACQGPQSWWLDQSVTSPNQSSRVRFIVLHYTRSDLDRALHHLTRGQVSSHYLVDRPDASGRVRVLRLVPDSERAWHAGVSHWQGRSHLNDTSIGIEIVNAGPRDTDAGRLWHAFPAEQVTAVAALVQELVARHGVPPEGLLSHAEIAPRRKVDPGPAFPWERLHREYGLGPWPEPQRVRAWEQRFRQRPPDLLQVQRALGAWGFALDPSGIQDAATCATLRAFQMRYRARDFRGAPDLDTLALLWALLEAHRPPSLLTELEEAAGGESLEQWRQACTVLPDGA